MLYLIIIPGGKMNKSQSTLLTLNQFTIMLISSMIGIGITYLPNSVIKDAKQDGWLACIIGSLYPLYMISIANYICGKFPNDNILTLSKKYLGAFFGNILNIIFISFFIFAATSEFAAFSNAFRVYATSFLKTYQIFLAALLPMTYAAYKGVKPLGRLNEIIFYLTVVLLLIPAVALIYGSVLNLMPFLGSGVWNIIKASKETTFFYTGIEIIFIIYPFLKDKGKLLRCGIISIIFTVAVYTWITILTIYYLGIDISPKYFWPVAALSDSINVPVINSFRYFFISFWAILVLRCITLYYFSASHGLNQVIRKVSAEKFTLMLYPVIFGISFLYGNPTTRRAYTDKLIHVYVIFNLIYVSLIAALIHFKRGGANEKN